MTKSIQWMLLVPLSLFCLASGVTLAYFGAQYIFHPAHNGGVLLKLEIDVETTTRNGAASTESLAQKCAQVLERRLRALVASAQVYVESPEGIRIEMPLPKDLERVVRLLESPGALELTLVEGEAAESRAALLGQFGGTVPEGLEVVCGSEAFGPMCAMVEKEPAITESDLEYASVGPGDLDEPGLSFVLTRPAAEKFGEITAASSGRNLAIVSNGQIVSMPRILGRIYDRGIINGLSLQEVEDLVVILRSARLPAPVRLIATEPIDGTSFLRHSQFRAGLAALFLMLSGGAIIVLLLIPTKASRGDSSKYPQA